MQPADTTDATNPSTDRKEENIITRGLKYGIVQVMRFLRLLDGSNTQTVPIRLFALASVTISSFILLRGSILHTLTPSSCIKFPKSAKLFAGFASIFTLLFTALASRTTHGDSAKIAIHSAIKTIRLIIAATACLSSF